MKLSIKHVIVIVCFAALFSGCRSAKPRVEETFEMGPVRCFAAEKQFHCIAPAGIWVLWTTDGSDRVEYSHVGEQISYPAPAEWTALEWTNGRTGVQFYVRHADGHTQFSMSK